MKGYGYPVNSNLVQAKYEAHQHTIVSELNKYFASKTIELFHRAETHGEYTSTGIAQVWSIGLTSHDLLTFYAEFCQTHNLEMQIDPVRKAHDHPSLEAASVESEFQYRIVFINMTDFDKQ